MVRFKLVSNGTVDLRTRDTYKGESFYIYGSIRYTDARRKPLVTWPKKYKSTKMISSLYVTYEKTPSRINV